MFDRSISHRGISFQDLGLTTLLLNNHSCLKVQETLEILDLFGLKITFSMKIIFYYFILFLCVFIIRFNLICIYIQDFMIKKPNLLNMGGTYCIYNVGLPFD
jgi:hypothetical protein